jgi:DNA polymerase-3 subunit alpha
MHEAHDAFLCIGEKTYVNVKDRRKYSEEHYLKNSEEMFKLFQDLPDAIENNINFPFRVSYRPKNSSPILPNIQTNKAKNVDDLLYQESIKGLNDKLHKYVFPYADQDNKIKRIRKNSGQDNKKEIEKFYNERLNHEIGIISKMKYSSYFLIVSDYIKMGKKK